MGTQSAILLTLEAIESPGPVLPMRGRALIYFRLNQRVDIIFFILERNEVYMIVHYRKQISEEYVHGS